MKCTNTAAPTAIPISRAPPAKRGGARRDEGEPEAHQRHHRRDHVPRTVATAEARRDVVEEGLDRSVILNPVVEERPAEVQGALHQHHRELRIDVLDAQPVTRNGRDDADDDQNRKSQPSERPFDSFNHGSGHHGLEHDGLGLLFAIRGIVGDRRVPPRLGLRRGRLRGLGRGRERRGRPHRGLGRGRRLGPARPEAAASTAREWAQARAARPEAEPADPLLERGRGRRRDRRGGRRRWRRRRGGGGRRARDSGWRRARR